MAKKLSQNEKIRRAFVRGMSRTAIANRLGVSYQTVYKATSPKHASKEFRQAAAEINAQRKAEREAEVPLLGE
jgi:transposase